MTELIKEEIVSLDTVENTCTPEPRGRHRKYFTDEEYRKAKSESVMKYYYNNREKAIERVTYYNKYKRTEEQKEAEKIRKKEYYQANKEAVKQKVKECHQLRRAKDKLEAEQRKLNNQT